MSSFLSLDLLKPPSLIGRSYEICNIRCMISVFEDRLIESDECREISEVTAMFARRLHRLSLFHGKCHGVTHRVIATIQLCTHHAYICICAIERIDRIINVNYRVCHSGLSNFSVTLPHRASLGHSAFKLNKRISMCFEFR